MRQQTYSNLHKVLVGIKSLKNCSYIISKIKDLELRSDEQFALKISDNKFKVLQKLADLISELEKLYDFFYDVNLYVYKAKHDKTIVEICYYSRLSLNPEYGVMDIYGVNL